MNRNILLFDRPGHVLSELRRCLADRVGPAGRVELVSSLRGLTRKLRRPEAWDFVVLDDHDIDEAESLAATLQRIRAVDADLPVVAVGGRDVGAARSAIEAGATDYVWLGDALAERVDILLAKLDRLAGLIGRKRRLEAEAERLHAAEDERHSLIGASPQMDTVLGVIRRVARVPRPVLIVGERGTGKELVARAIHREGGAATRPFVAVNCAAVAETLLESELFGHERGAFTGAATARPGKFELAAGGTLFLDEVGNMSLAFQQKILRVVEYGTFTRVGGDSECVVETRIVAATNADLAAKMERGEFLRDLYDRLAFEVLEVPALREREGEIGVLADHFLELFMREVPAFRGKRLSREALDLLHRYPFPGNVRELKNIIERAVYRDTTNELTPEDIGPLATDAARHASGGFRDQVLARERQLLSEALQAADGNRAQAARSLSMPYHQFRHYCRKHGLGI